MDKSPEGVTQGIIPATFCTARHAGIFRTPEPAVDSRSRSSLRLSFLFYAGVVVVVAGWSREKENLLLTTPRLALEALTAKVLYFNGPAQPWLLAQRADLLTPEDRDARSTRARAFAQAVVSPTLFRQLDRQHRFDTLLFVGDPSQYRTLLDHLVERKDFTLAYVDHTSLVFKRPAVGKWSLAEVAAVRARLGGPANREQADFSRPDGGETNRGTSGAGGENLAR